MAGGMKHEIDFPVDQPRNHDLPDAPMAMPRQVLEWRLDWGSVLRLFQFVRLRRG
jgi:hypothetical protein